MISSLFHKIIQLNLQLKELILKQPTISDVAEAAEVSKTTLSRYLNHNYSHMSAKTKDRIEQVIKELGYRPNKHAQSLKANQTHEIGIQVADITNAYIGQLIKGVGPILRKNNYQMQISDANNSPRIEHQQLQSLIDKRVDGIILQPTDYNSSNYAFVHEANIPLVLVDRNTVPSNWPAVTSDNQHSVSQLANLIIKKNYKRVVTISHHFNPLSNSSMRYQFFKQQLNKFNQTCETFLINGNNLIELLTEIKASTKKTAIFATNIMALEILLKNIAKLNLSFPTDLGIAYYDGCSWTQFVNHGITTIRQEPTSIGQFSAEILMQQLNGLPINPLNKVIPTKLIETNSL